MFREHYNLWIVLAGTSLLGMTAGVVGCFAVLRKRSLLGDALGHAALPGLCLGFLIAGQRSLPALLAGALATGFGGILAFAFIQRSSRLKEDAGIAVVLSVFYAAGVVGLSLLAKRPSAGQAGLESFLFGKTAGMLFEDVVWIAGLAALSLGATAIFLKELRLVAFDAEFARTQGWPTARIDLLLMTLIAFAVVVGLPAVGALLVAALLVIPAAAARFWTDRLGAMLIVAGAIGTVSGAIGSLASGPLPTAPTGPVIILAAAAMFAVSVAFGSARGLLRRQAIPPAAWDEETRRSEGGNST